MSHQVFFDDNLALARSLAGTAGIAADRVHDRSLAWMDDVHGQHERVTKRAKPALTLWPGDGRYEPSSFPLEGEADQPGHYAVIWHVYLPHDRLADWVGRWEALLAAVRGALCAPGALVAPRRPGPASVRWGEEPPLFLGKTTSPAGAELYFTVAMEVF